MTSKGDWSWLLAEAARQKWSLSQLAILLEVEPQTIRHWIKGRSDPSLQNALKLALLFCGGSMALLAERANLSLARLGQELHVQLEGLQLPPPRPGAAFTPLRLPPDFLRPGAETELAQALHVVRELNDLLRRTGQYHAMKAQAAALIAQLDGPHSPRSAPFWLDLAYAGIMLGRYHETVEAAQTARGLMHPGRDAGLLGDSHWLSLEGFRVLGDFDVAREHGEAAQLAYRRGGLGVEHSGVRWLGWNIAHLEAMAGRFPHALEQLAQAQEVAQASRHRYELALILWSKGYTYERLGQYAAALKMHREAHRLAQTLGDLYWEATPIWRIAEILLATGNLAAARVDAERALCLHELLGNANLAAHALLTLAQIDLRRGDLVRALHQYERAAIQFQKDADMPMLRLARLGGWLVKLAELTYRPDANYRSLREVTRLVAQPAQGRTYWNVELAEQLIYAEMLRLEGQAAEAYQHFQMLARLAADGGYRLAYAHALLGMAASRLALGQADWNEGVQAQQIYRELPCPWGEVQALLLQSRLYRADVSQAGVLLEQAAHLAESADLRWDLRLIEWWKRAPEQAHLRHALLFTL